MPTPIATSLRLRQFLHGCRRPGVIAAALLVLGAAARMRQYFAVTSYWHDEAYLLLNVFPKSFLELVGPLSHDQAAPPLFLWILRACYLTLGPTELSMRLPALMASLAAIVLMVPLARKIVGGQSWLFAVGCTALSSCLLHLTYQVKPYTIDVLLAEAILLATVGCLGGDITRASRRISGFALVFAAAIGPWLSFPSVFMTAGACIVVVLREKLAGGNKWLSENSVVGRPSRPSSARDGLEGRPTETLAQVSKWQGVYAWRGWPFARANVRAFAKRNATMAITTATLLLGSCLALWLLAARYHNTDYQQSFWAADFLDLSSPAAACAWLGRKLVEAGNYGMHGSGIPMALLAAVGLVTCRRQKPWLALSLVLPAALACLAAAARHYPLGNRLLAFLLPCLWLLAAQGVEAVIERFQRRASWVIALPVVLLLPAAVYTARYSIFAKPSVEFRQALAYIHDQMREGDSLWVSQPEVHEVYFGTQPRLDVRSPASALAAAAARGRVWMLCHPPSSDTRISHDARRQLKACGAQPKTKFNFVHLDVTLFSPTELPAVVVKPVQRMPACPQTRSLQASHVMRPKSRQPRICLCLMCRAGAERMARQAAPITAGMRR